MPTLTRLILSLAVIIALIYGAMLALVAYVQPTTGALTIQIPTSQLQPEPIAPPTPPVAAPAPTTPEE